MLADDFPEQTFGLFVLELVVEVVNVQLGGRPERFGTERPVCLEDGGQVRGFDIFSLEHDDSGLLFLDWIGTASCARYRFRALSHYAAGANAFEQHRGRLVCRVLRH